MDQLVPTQVMEVTNEPWELKKLSPSHKTAAALLAQGVDRRTIAEVTDFTPEYITMLGRQPLFREYIRDMNKFTEARLDALFEKSVDVIHENMMAGGELGLKAAKLQLEATGRVGRFQTTTPQQGGEDRLETLAERLVELLHHQRRRIYDAEVVEVLSDGSLSQSA
jgi:hypothetical protein